MKIKNCYKVVANFTELYQSQLGGLDESDEEPFQDNGSKYVIECLSDSEVSLETLAELLINETETENSIRNEDMERVGG